MAFTVGFCGKSEETGPSSLQLAYDIAEEYANEFLDWGPIFTDYSPFTATKAMAM
jgi:hypothetical protein